MCGIVALLSNEPVNQRLYDALLLLQHRGQDAAGAAALRGRPVPDDGSTFIRPWAWCATSSVRATCVI